MKVDFAEKEKKINFDVKKDIKKTRLQIFSDEIFIIDKLKINDNIKDKMKESLTEKYENENVFLEKIKAKKMKLIESGFDILHCNDYLRSLTPEDYKPSVIMKIFDYASKVQSFYAFNQDKIATLLTSVQIKRIETIKVNLSEHYFKLAYNGTKSDGIAYKDLVFMYRDALFLNNITMIVLKDKKIAKSLFFKNALKYIDENLEIDKSRKINETNIEDSLDYDIPF